MTLSLNLCEVLNTNLLESTEDGLAHLINCIEQNRSAKVNRLRVGSDFCANYFLSYPWKKYFERIDIPTTLVLPVFTEKNLLLAKKIISNLISSYGNQIDEVTVNDFGMIRYLQINYPLYKLNAGRLLIKSSRDRRMNDLYHIGEKSRDYEKYNSILESANFDSIEFDLNYDSFYLDKVKCKNKVSVHYPYCYVTTGNICKFGSVHKPLEKKFRPNCSCEMECQNIYEFYPKGEFIRIGRTIYFNNEKCRIDKNSFDTILYFPIKEILQMKKEEIK